MDFYTQTLNALTPDLEKKAEKELGETPALRDISLKELKELIKEIPNFYPLLDDAFLLKFLRVRKYDVQRTLKIFLKYYTFNKDYSKLYTHFVPSELKAVLNMNMLFLLPKKHPNGAAIFWARCAHLDMEIGTIDDIGAFSVVCSEIALKQESTQVSGAYIILDFKDCTLQHTYHMLSLRFVTKFVKYLQPKGSRTPQFPIEVWHHYEAAFEKFPETTNCYESFLKPKGSRTPQFPIEVWDHYEAAFEKFPETTNCYGSFLKECWPCRLKGIYVVNEPLYLHYVYRIMYPFFTKKLKQRCHIYGDNIKPLHKHIPQDILPYELGGTAEPINVFEFQSFILGHEAYLQKINQYGFKDD